MIELYATLIINKRRSISTIPSTLKAAVIGALLSKGYDENGDKITED